MSLLQTTDPSTSSGRSRIFQGNSNFLLSDVAPPPERPHRPGRDSILAVLWRQRYVVGACAVGCFILAVLYLLIATPIYTSTAGMKVTLAASRLSGEAQAITDSSAGNYLYTERELIMSPAVLSLAAQAPQVKPLLEGEPDPIYFLQKGLSVEIGKRATVISVSFSSTDRDAARTIANGIVDAYMAYQTKPKVSDTAELNRMAAERAKVEQTIAAANQQMLGLEQKYGVLGGPGEHGTLAERQLAALSPELHLAHLETLKSKADYEQAASFLKDSKIAPASDPDALPDLTAIGPDQQAQLRTELLQLQNQLNRLRQQYLSDHPYILMLRKQIGEKSATYARAIERQYMIARQREQDLQAEFNAQQKQAIEISAKSAQYQRLAVEVENARKVEDQIDSRRREIEMARDLGMLNIDPYERAKAELKPSHPNKRTTLPLALMLGLLLGGGVGYLRDWRDDRYRTVDEIRGSTGLQLLGIVPRVQEGLMPSIVGQLALLEPMSEVAEACRMIRTAIQFGAPKDRCTTLLVTSPEAGEGKSTLAANLAVTMAQAGKRVLLVDADLRIPRQQVIFCVHGNGGLSSVLEGQATLDQAIQPTEVNGLEILTSGPKPHNPSEMLNSPMFTELLEVLSERYDHVIVDSAPVVGVADSRIIAASCDMTVLVLRAQKSTRRTSELARDGLASVGAHLLGIVINDVSAGEGVMYSYGRPQIRSAARSLDFNKLANSGS
jgi:polysaccharide biosynthesis transport protein